ncbi:DUF551 domain-containing protein [Enterobacter hormaechei]|uniref:DUF551 domain-containing protein n=1 Tax=unclassified Enterobacter cloacae complex TaxID=2757714 RepID=UPI001D0243AF|nr:MULTISPECIES: DUF551 domain-containing protein [unclassified Enterobacter cloacae complex]
MSTLTKEWLLKTIAELEEERDAVPGIVNEDAAMALEAMKRALASLRADPVAWTDEQELRDVEKYGCGYLFTAYPITPHADPRRVIKLYTIPPAPVVPDECPVEIRDLLASHSDALFHDGDAQEIWNACRAAMLQGAEPVTTAYKLPEGWVACSERMPMDGFDVLCASEFDGPGDWRRKVGYWHCGKWVVYGASWTPTHWMPLPAAPH